MLWILRFRVDLRAVLPNLFRLIVHLAMAPHGLIRRLLIADRAVRTAQQKQQIRVSRRNRISQLEMAQCVLPMRLIEVGFSD